MAFGKRKQLNTKNQHTTPLHHSHITLFRAEGHVSVAAKGLLQTSWEAPSSQVCQMGHPGEFG